MPCPPRGLGYGRHRPAETHVPCASGLQTHVIGREPVYVGHIDVHPPPSIAVTLTSLECCRVFGTLSCSRTWGTSPLMSRDRRSFRGARTSSRTCHNDTGTLAWRYPAIAFSVRQEKKQGVVSWLAQPPESHQRIGLSRMQLPGHGL